MAMAVLVRVAHQNAMVAELKRGKKRVKRSSEELSLRRLTCASSAKFNQDDETFVIKFSCLCADGWSRKGVEMNAQQIAQQITANPCFIKLNLI